MIQWFEPRPPKIAATQLQQTDDPGTVVEQLRKMPGVARVNVEYHYYDDPFIVVVNPNTEAALKIYEHHLNGCWLVATPSEPDDEWMITWSLALLDDQKFRSRYQESLPAEALVEVS